MLLTVLKKIGKDFNAFGTWVEDAIKAVAPAVSAVDPPLGALITSVENAITEIQSATNGTVSAESLASLTQAITTVETIKAQLKNVGPITL